MMQKNEYKEIVNGMLVIAGLVVEEDDLKTRMKMCSMLVMGYDALNEAIDNEWHDEFVSYTALCSMATGIVAMSDKKSVRFEGMSAVSGALGEIGHKIYS